MKEESIKYLLSLKGCQILREMKNNRTAKQYSRINERFCAWLAGQGVKRESQLVRKYGTYTAAIQAWADHLDSEGKSADTIHTYVAAVCKSVGISLDEIDKPKRRCSRNIRSRSGTGKNPRSDAEMESGRYDDLIAFQSVVGIRRAELAKLRKNDFEVDESGHWCVLVRRGKGGKRQLQRILPDDIELVRYFMNGSDKPVFNQADMSNHIDLHHLRAQHAQKCYEHYASLKGQEREQLREELKKRYWAMHRGNMTVETWLRKNLLTDGGVYRLRGSNKALAEKLGLPTEYDRLALLATSVFHLSHWRIDVSVSNYMLAY